MTKYGRLHLKINKKAKKDLISQDGTWLSYFQHFGNHTKTAVYKELLEGGTCHGITIMFANVVNGGGKTTGKYNLADVWKQLVMESKP